MQSLTTKDYLRLKKEGYSERPRKSLVIKENGRSSDFIIPNFALGCDYVCSYCYVARNRPMGNPVELYTNTDNIINAVIKHAAKLSPKVANQCDPVYYSYDIGESSDLLGPSVINTTNKLITELVKIPNVKPTFATKAGSPTRINKLVNCPIVNKARIRASLMPQHISDLLEVGTAKIVDRLLGLNVAFNKGYECHINLSPVILYKNWEDDYIQLCWWIDKLLTPEVKQQLKAEVIFLTHDAGLHEMNMQWRPHAEELLWTPHNQEVKINNRNSKVLRYQWQLKQKAVEKMKWLLATHLPYCEIRYIF
jgi:spore photoproduct lyase